MPTARKSKLISQPYSAAEVAAARAAAETVKAKAPAVDWRRGVVTRGVGVAATVEALRRTRGPNKNPTKEQVAIRLAITSAGGIRAGGPGWQTRMNAALKEWIADQPAVKRKAGRARVGD